MLGAEDKTPVDDAVRSTQPQRGVVNTSPEPPSAQDPPRKARDGLESLFLDIMEPVRKAAADHQTDPTQFFPSDKEMAAAVATKSLDSDESQLILNRLKKGYTKYNMPFPSLDAPSSSGPVSAPSDRTDPKIVEAWLVPTINRLKEEAEAKDIAVQALLPSQEMQTAAIESGTFDSPECKALLEKLKIGYQQLQIELPDPKAISQNSAPPPESSQNGGSASRDPQTSAEMKIINAYFQGQLQRIKLESKKQEKDVSDCFPGETELQKAAASGSISSAESIAMIDMIEACYQRLDIPFHPPIQR